MKHSEITSHHYLEYTKKRDILEYDTCIYNFEDHENTEYHIHESIMYSSVGEDEIKWWLNIYKEQGASYFQKLIFKYSREIYGCADSLFHSGVSDNNNRSTLLIFGQMTEELLNNGIQFMFDKYSFCQIIYDHVKCDMDDYYYEFDTYG